MKIEPDTFYLTRDGSLAYVGRRSKEDLLHPYFGAIEDFAATWTAEGYWSLTGDKHRWDLVIELSETAELLFL